MSWARLDRVEETRCVLANNGYEIELRREPNHKYDSLLSKRTQYFDII